MKKINITTGALLVYLIVMSVIGWPGNKPEPDYTQYSLVIAVSFGIILLLRFVQIKRLKTREKLREENKTKYSED